MVHRNENDGLLLILLRNLGKSSKQTHYHSPYYDYNYLSIWAENNQNRSKAVNSCLAADPKSQVYRMSPRKSEKCDIDEKPGVQTRQLIFALVRLIGTAVLGFPSRST